MEEKKVIHIGVTGVIIIIAIIVLAVCGIVYYRMNNKTPNNNDNNYNNYSPIQNNTPIPTNSQKQEIGNNVASDKNIIDNFDLSFLKIENEKKNKIYSPLSIKYALKMLEEGANGESKAQISRIIGSYMPTKYTSNEHMSLANSMFIRDSFQNDVKDSYINTLKEKFNAEVKFDPFENAKNINSWINDKTLGIIEEMLQDNDVENLRFALINALAIDMEWNHKFLWQFYEDDKNITPGQSYYHEKFWNDDGQCYSGWGIPQNLSKRSFNDNTENDKYSTMKVVAAINKYDAIKELGGEENIRSIVFSDFKDWALGTGNYSNSWNGQSDYGNTFNGDYSDENIKKIFDEWFDDLKNDGAYSYIKGLSSNYGDVSYSTDFSLYVDDNIKAFAKDLKEYDGTTLQYIGIMPIKDDLSDYITKAKSEDIQKIINNLKDLKNENFKEGYLTYIYGYIPKFNFEYDLNLKEDLKEMGITDVFELGKADLSNLTETNDTFISDAKHKANIEFTQDGIKAAAVTMVGGGGGGDWYDYLFEIPTEKIDITFDKPYMFIIRDKTTGETWFAGTVYEPTLWDEDTTKTNEI